MIAKRTSRSPDLTSSGTPAFPGLLPVASLAPVRITVAGAVTDSHRIPFSNNRSNDQAVTVTLSNNIQFPNYILSRTLGLVNIKSALSPNSLDSTLSTRSFKQTYGDPWDSSQNRYSVSACMPANIRPDIPPTGRHRNPFAAFTERIRSVCVVS